MDPRVLVLIVLVEVFAWLVYGLTAKTRVKKVWVVLTVGAFVVTGGASGVLLAIATESPVPFLMLLFNGQAAAWVYLNSLKRGMNPVWALSVFLVPIVGLAAYLLVRSDFGRSGAEGNMTNQPEIPDSATPRRAAPKWWSEGMKKPAYTDWRFWVIVLLALLNLCWEVVDGG